MMEKDMRKVLWVLFLIIFGIFLLKALSVAQQNIPLEEKIFQKLETILEGQSKIQDQLNKILSNQEEIKRELEVIKIRATVH